VFEVWGDGSRLYQSGLLTGSTAPEAISVDVSGLAELRLIVGDGGNGVGYDHANWADARLTCSVTPDPEALFAPVTTYATGAHSHGVVSADVTGDGLLDLIVANAGDSSVSVLPGNGDGTFAGGRS
jgi:hypothetical protein